MLTGVRLKQKVAPAARMLHALGNVHRLAIVHLLRMEPQTSEQIQRRVQLSSSLTIHHMDALRRAGLVQKSKFGKIVSYTVKEEAVKAILTFFKK